MPNTVLADRLLKREVGRSSIASKPKGIYGDRQWVKDLDIVNELAGHRGCVNALSWSKSGSLLASGSDDTHLNIHSYQHLHSSTDFKLDTTIDTGHTANIFSVKFMPHSNDRTLISAAGDAEIRVFDIEYAGRSTAQASATSTGARSYLNNGIRYLGEADTNARVYRSHSDRVKRLVTESSPYLFLSCSEDGEVRQWDLRQSSSAYPRPRTSRGYSRSGDDGEAPPPLISYKRHQLDLNSISCSPSQPHYIALGGAHLHCFLHDRRMLGRDIARERGQRTNYSSTNMRSDAQENAMSEATQCVRRFAPNGEEKMKRSQTGHVTALKISDANPREMVASWSTDWIYNFDLLRTPDAREPHRHEDLLARERKRKKRAAGTVPGKGSLRKPEPKIPRSRSTHHSQAQTNDDMALRIRYGNGQDETIPLNCRGSGMIANEQTAIPLDSLSQAQKLSRIVGRLSVKVRKHIFTLEDPQGTSDADPTGHSSSFANAQECCAKALYLMDHVMQKWAYPVNPDDDELHMHAILRSNRDRSRRFIQACATLSRVLVRRPGREQQTREVITRTCTQIQSASFERPIESRSEQFSYDFIKAILLWLDGGVGGLIRGFASAAARGARNRNPLPVDANIDSIDEILIPYLLDLASDRAITNVDASRFEVDESRILFSSEKAAVVVFARAIKIPFEDLSGAPMSGNSGDLDHLQARDRKAALRDWGLRVARGVLMNVGEGITFSFVDKAFGGLGITSRGIDAMEMDLAQQQGTIDTEDDDLAVDSIGLLTSNRSTLRNGDDDNDDSDEEMVAIDDVRNAIMDGAASFTDEAGDANIEDNDAAMDFDHDSTGSFDNDDGNDDYNDNNGEDDEDDAFASGSFDNDTNTPFARAFRRSTARTRVQAHIPCTPPQLHYSGHSNTRTVKDVNYYGLNDEYVVSGSDSGHLFIWDRASGQLLNILEGDGDVVNVVQGHPYEPMLAVSGIDNTVKIFSADARARRAARKGVGLSNSISMGPSTRARHGARMRTPRQEGPGSSEPAAIAADNSSDVSDKEDTTASDEGLSSRRRMHDEYKITSQNDADRRGGGGGGGGAFITRNMLAQLVARMQTRRRGGGEDRDGNAEAGAGDDGEGERAEMGIEIDENGMPVVPLGDGRVAVAPDCGVQ